MCCQVLREQRSTQYRIVLAPIRKRHERTACRCEALKCETCGQFISDKETTLHAHERTCGKERTKPVHYTDNGKADSQWSEGEVCVTTSACTPESRASARADFSLSLSLSR